MEQNSLIGRLLKITWKTLTAGCLLLCLFVTPDYPVTLI